jgi:hypothetical protein
MVDVAETTASRTGRRVTILAAQVLNSTTNLAVSLLLSHSLASNGFGVVALIQSIALIGLALSRGLAVESSLFDNASSLTERMSRAIGGASLVAAVLLGACAAIGLAVGKVAVVVALALAIGAALACAQDAARSALLVADRADQMLRSDLWWAIAQTTVTIALIGAGAGIPIAASVGWAAGGLAALVSARRSTRAVGAVPRADFPTMRFGLAWGLEFAVAVSTLQLTLIVVAAVGGLDDAGAIRGAVVLTGPATLLLAAAHQIGVVRFSNDAMPSDHRLASAARRFGLLTAVLALACTAPLLAIPDSLGNTLLGSTWTATRAVLPWLVLQRAAVAFAEGPQLALRRLGVRWASLWFRVGLTTIVCLAAAAATTLEGVGTACAVLAAGGLAAAVFWDRLVRRNIVTAT